MVGSRENVYFHNNIEQQLPHIQFYSSVSLTLCVCACVSILFIHFDKVSILISGIWELLGML